MRIGADIGGSAVKLVCADDNNLDIQMAFAEGSPAAYSVAFEAKAVAQGFLPTYEMFICSGERCDL